MCVPLFQGARGARRGAAGNREERESCHTGRHQMRASDIGSATLPGNRYGKLNQDHAVRARSLSLSPLSPLRSGALSSFLEAGGGRRRCLFAPQHRSCLTNETTTTPNNRSPRAYTLTRSSRCSRAPSEDERNLVRRLLRAEADVEHAAICAVFVWGALAASASARGGGARDRLDSNVRLTRGAACFVHPLTHLGGSRPAWTPGDPAARPSRGCAERDASANQHQKSCAAGRVQGTS